MPVSPHYFSFDTKLFYIQFIKIEMLSADENMKGHTGRYLVCWDRKTCQGITGNSKYFGIDFTGECGKVGTENAAAQARLFATVSPLFCLFVSLTVYLYFPVFVCLSVYMS